MTGEAMPTDVRERLVAAGASEEEIERAARSGDVYALAGDLVRRRDITWATLEEVAATAGVTVDDVRRYRRLVGLSPEEPLVPTWTATGVADYLLASALAGEEGARDFLRVLAGAAAKVAATATAWFLNEVAPRLDESPTPTGEAIDMVEGMTTALLARTPAAFEILFREHQFIAARRGRLEHEAELARVAVGFVDLTGSTSWAEHLTHAEHAAALSRFEDASASAASVHGARVVKMIGDEAMLVASEPPAVARTAADICAMADADPVLPPARGAVGYGYAYARSGDYFGPLVNLVARAVKIAEPGQLTVTPPVASTLEGTGLHLGEVQNHQLRGIEDPVQLVPVTRPRRVSPDN